MKKTILSIWGLLILLLLSSSLLAAGNPPKPLEGSYPIVLSQGLFGRGDLEVSVAGILGNSWGGMDDYLRSQGATVYVSKKTGMASNELRAAELREGVLLWMAANGAEKVNYIGRSQGSLDTRYMISNLGMGTRTGVYTSLNGVHRGSPLPDLFKAVMPDWLEPFVDAAAILAVGLFYGDVTSQSGLDAVAALSIETLPAFNAATPNVPGVKYYSYGSFMTWPDPIQHPTTFVFHPIVAAGGLLSGLGAANDGIVPLESQKWGVWKGTPDIAWFVSGLDHGQTVNFQGSGTLGFDIDGFYLEMAQNMKANQ